MRIRILSFIFISMFLLICAILLMAPGSGNFEAAAKNQDLSSDLPFETGECLTYQVLYKNVKVGHSVLEFHGERDMGDKKVYYIKLSTDIPSLEDTEELYAEKNTFLPIEVHRTIKKTLGFNERIEEKYDQENFKVEITSKSALRSKSFSIEKDSPIHNAILLAYYYRTQSSFKQGESFEVTLPTFEFNVMFEGIETLKTPAGEYQAYAFSSDPPKFKLWLSADKRKTPLKIENPGTLGYSLIIESLN